MKRLKRMAALFVAAAIVLNGIASEGLIVQAEETVPESTSVSVEDIEEPSLQSEQELTEGQEMSSESEEVSKTFLDVYEVKPKVSYSVHMQNYGWLEEVSDGMTSGKAASGKRLEAFKAEVSGVENLGISYQAFCDVTGWTSTSSDGDMCGSTGESRRIEAIRMVLTGSAASDYNVYYRTYVSGYGWLDWGCNGNIAGSDHSYGKSLEAIEIVISKNGEAGPGETENPFLNRGDADLGDTNVSSWISCTAYSGGEWLQSVYADNICGDSSNELVEAIKITLNQSVYSGTIQYRVQMQTYGWMDYVSSGEESGKTGSGKRVEAFQLRLTGELESLFNIYYRVYVEGYGWLDWAENGETAGTVGMSAKMLAYQVALKRKGESAPGSVNRPSIDGTVSEYYPNTHINTGNQIQDLIAVAKTQIGYKLEADGTTKYGTWYNSYVNANGTYYPSAPWCAMFISWCGEQAGIPNTIFYRHSATVNLSSWYQNTTHPGNWYDKSEYIPKAGDLIFFRYESNNSNFVNHVGIVTSVSNEYVYTIEGNSNDSVRSGSYLLDNENIVGYAVPAYEEDGETSEDPTTPTVPDIVEKMEISYSGYIDGEGWSELVCDGELAGTTGQASALQAVKIILSGNEMKGSISYRAHMQTSGWTGWSVGGDICGLPDGGKRMEAIEIKLSGDIESLYDIYYRTFVQTYGWLGWAKNGESAGTEGLSKRVEAIEIKLVEKGSEPPGTAKVAFMKKSTSQGIQYTVHAQTYGWLANAADGATSGTTGESKRLEAITIGLTGIDGGVSYRTHVQTYGWQPWKTNGEVSGTTGKSKRLEAIQIKLTGAASEKYDIYYRVHVQTYGWLDWAKNGDYAGTSGLSRRMEAIEICLVEKGKAAPGRTDKAYYSK